VLFGAIHFMSLGSYSSAPGKNVRRGCREFAREPWGFAHEPRVLPVFDSVGSRSSGRGTQSAGLPIDAVAGGGVDLATVASMCTCAAAVASPRRIALIHARR